MNKYFKLISIILFLIIITTISYSVELALKKPKVPTNEKLPREMLPLTLFEIVVEISDVRQTDKVYGAEFHLEFNKEYFDVVDENLTTVNSLKPLAPFNKYIFINTITDKDTNTKIINYSAAADITSPPTGSEKYNFVKFYLMGKKGTGKIPQKLIIPDLSKEQCTQQGICSAVIVEHEDGQVITYGYGSTENKLNLYNAGKYDMIIKPLPPVNLQAATIFDAGDGKLAPYNDKVKLTWQAAGDSGIKYNVYYYAQGATQPEPSKDEDYKKVSGCTSLTKLECIDTKVVWDEAGKKYWYKVSAIDESNKEGKLSIEPATIMDQHPPQSITVSDACIFRDPKSDISITAKVDEPAKIEVEWGMSQNYGNIQTSELDKISPYTPSVTITNLTPGEILYYRVKVIDATGGEGHTSCFNTNGTLTCPGENRTRTVCSEPPRRPNITNIGAQTDGCTVTVTWDTDVEADSKVFFDKMPSPSANSVYDPAMMLTHSVTIPTEGCLETNVTYYYKACSNSVPGNDQYNNCSADKTIKIGPPQITHTPISSAFENQALQITATITGGIGTITAKIYYSRDTPPWGAPPTTYIDMTKSGETYTGTIPAAEVIKPAIYYYIYAIDSAATPQEVTSPAQGKDNPYKVTVGGTAAELTISHTPVTSGVAGVRLCTACEVTGGQEPYSVILKYGSSATNLTKSIPMTNTAGARYEGCIPASDVTPPLYYQIFAEDSSSPPKSAKAPSSPQSVSLTTRDVGTISGVVNRLLPDQTTQPLAGVKISIIGQARDTLSDVEGRYSFGDVPVGIYSLKAEKFGYTTEQKDNIEVRKDQITEVNFTLTEPARLSGYCYNIKYNTVIPALKIFAINKDTNYTYPYTRTNEEGKFTFSDLKPGNYEIYVDSSSALELGYHEPSAEKNDLDGPWTGNLITGDNPQIQFKLTPLGIVQVVITPRDVSLGIGSTQAFTATAYRGEKGVREEIKNITSVIWQLTNPDIGKLEQVPGTNMVKFKATKLGEGRLIVKEVNDEDIVEKVIIKNETKGTHGAYIKVTETVSVSKPITIHKKELDGRIGQEYYKTPVRPSIKGIKQGTEAVFIRYSVSNPDPSASITLRIYNLKGRLVKEINKYYVSECGKEGKPETCQTEWDCKDELGRIIPNGIYIIQISIVGAKGTSVIRQPIGVFKRK